MPQFIKYHDIETDSDVIINKNHIQEIREKRNHYKKHPEHLEIVFTSGKVIDVVGSKTSETAYNRFPLMDLNKN